MLLRQTFILIAICLLVSCVSDTDNQDGIDLPVAQLQTAPLNEAKLRTASKNELLARLRHGVKLIKKQNSVPLSAEGGADLFLRALALFSGNREDGDAIIRKEFGISVPVITNSKDVEIEKVTQVPIINRGQPAVKFDNDSMIMLQLEEKKAQEQSSNLLYYKRSNATEKLSLEHSYKYEDLVVSALFPFVASSNIEKIAVIATQKSTTPSYLDLTETIAEGSSFGDLSKPIPKNLGNGKVTIDIFESNESKFSPAWNVQIDGALIKAIERDNQLYIATRFDYFGDLNDSVQRSPVDNLLPTYSVNNGLSNDLLSGCLVSENSRYIDAFNSLLNVTVIDLENQKVLGNVCVNENLGGLYFADDNIYIGGSNYEEWENPLSVPARSSSMIDTPYGRTVLHKFLYRKGMVPEYDAFSSIPGYVNWSFPEQRMHEIYGGLVILTSSTTEKLLFPKHRYQLYWFIPSFDGVWEIDEYIPNDVNPEPLTAAVDVDPINNSYVNHVRFARDHAILQTRSGYFLAQDSVGYRLSKTIIGYRDTKVIKFEKSRSGQFYEYTSSIAHKKDIVLYHKVIGEKEDTFPPASPYLYQDTLEIRDTSDRTVNKVLASVDLTRLGSFFGDKPRLYLHYESDTRLKIAYPLMFGKKLQLLEVTNYTSDTPEIVDVGIVTLESKQPSSSAILTKAKHVHLLFEKDSIIYMQDGETWSMAWAAQDGLVSPVQSN